MITHLHIEGMAIIDSLDIDFSPGFNVITGETGAGKSILIRALHFLMGARSSADTIRSGAKQCRVSGEFWLEEDHPALRVIEEIGIDGEVADGGVVIIVRRSVTTKGRSQAWINDVTVTRQTLKKFGNELVDIFAQHENQKLMVETEHLRYLDRFLKDSQLKKEVAKHFQLAWESFGKLQKDIGEIAKGGQDRDYFEFRYQELESFGPTEEDFKKVSLLAGSGGSRLKIKEALQSAMASLESGEDNVGARLRECGKSLAQICNAEESEDSFQKLNGRVDQLSEEADDIQFELSKALDSVDVDEEDLESCQSRLYGYQDLFRKHTVSDVEGLLEKQQSLRSERELLENASKVIQSDLENLLSHAQLLEKTSAVLAKARKKAAVTASGRVEQELSDLAMKGATFSVTLHPVQKTVPDLGISAIDPSLSKLWVQCLEILASHNEMGADRGRFLLASNPGEPAMPLSKIASGGEMSRILLALKKALAADAETCVLVFDEIDTGISGRIADVVGRKLRELSNAFQVICISHLAQVAVYADSHYQVLKMKRNKRSQTEIVSLSSKESANEIARLLSGEDLTPTSLANAKALMMKAREKPSVVC